MTSFLIGFPDVPYQASTITSSLTVGSGYSVKNIITGGRPELFQVGTASSAGLTLTIDLGASVTKQAQYVALLEAKTLQRDSVTSVTVKGGSTSTYSSGTSVYTTSSFASASLVGPYNRDFIATFSLSSAYRYWFLNFGVSAASYYCFSKLYLETWFDFGREPLVGPSFNRQKDDPYERDPKYRFSLTWGEVTDTKVNELEGQVKYAATNPVVLYDGLNAVLPGSTMMHARIVGTTITPRLEGFNEVTIDFEELI